MLFISNCHQNCETRRNGNRLILWKNETVNILSTFPQGAHFCSNSLSIRPQFSFFETFPLAHVDIAAMVLYAVTGALLVCLTSRTKNLSCLILSVNISTLVSLFAASAFTGFTIFAFFAISDSSGGSDLKQAIGVLLNSLVMLLATSISTIQIWQISFKQRRNAATDSRTNIHVSVPGNRSLTSEPRSRLEVADEGNRP